MARSTQKNKALPAKKPASKRENAFFVVPEKKQEAVATPGVRVQLGGLPLETKAGFELVAYRLKSLLANTSTTWEDIAREEHGSFWSLFKKYHLPLLVPYYIFFALREALHFVNWTLFLRYTLFLLPLFTLLYAAYIFLLALIVEETAELSGGRFSPQSGLRVALFSTLIVSFLAVGTLLPVVGIPILALGIFWHYRQLFHGASTLLNISPAYYKISRLSILFVWVFMGLAAFVVLSLVSFFGAKIGLRGI